MKLSEKLTILLGVFLFALFVVGLAWSISTGLAGFWRGLPIAVGIGLFIAIIIIFSVSISLSS